MKSKGFVLPNADSEFLSDVLGSIRKRSKSLKYHSAEFKVDRVLEQYDDGRVEKVEIEAKPFSHNAHAKFEVWEDRWILVSAFRRTKNTKWVWRREGKLLPIYSSLEFVLALQSTVLGVSDMDEAKIQDFDLIWQPLLANGPEVVR